MFFDYKPHKAMIFFICKNLFHHKKQAQYGANHTSCKHKNGALLTKCAILFIIIFSNSTYDELNFKREINYISILYH